MRISRLSPEHQQAAFRSRPPKMLLLIQLAIAQIHSIQRQLSLSPSPLCACARGHGVSKCCWAGRCASGGSPTELRPGLPSTMHGYARHSSATASGETHKSVILIRSSSRCNARPACVMDMDVNARHWLYVWLRTLSGIIVCVVVRSAVRVVKTLLPSAVCQCLSCADI
jgi:hypothetical protein